MTNKTTRQVKIWFDDDYSLAFAATVFEGVTDNDPIDSSIVVKFDGLSDKEIADSITEVGRNVIDWMFVDHIVGRSEFLMTLTKGNTMKRKTNVEDDRGFVWSDGYVVTDNPKSWQVLVIADRSGEWASNGMRYATKERAEEAARNLASRWMLVTDWKVEPSTDEVKE